MKRKSFRAVVASALVTTALSLSIGGFATISLRDSQIETVDQQLQKIVDAVRSNPDSPVSSALDAASEEDFNITIAIVSSDEEITIINESKLILGSLPEESLIAAALISPVTVEDQENYRLLAQVISGGDRLIFADSLSEIEESFSSNLERLLIFTVFADLVAIAISALLLARNKRKLEAESLLRMQQFLADASHDLRTPLTVIKGYSELLSKGQITNPEDRGRAFERVNSEIIRMENLIHDLLLLAELGETSRPIFAEFDLSDLLTSYVHDFTTLNPDRQIVEEIESGVMIEGSLEHLRRLIQNVFNNIARHTPVDAAVKVYLGRQGKKVRLTIEDGGAGLPPSGYRDGVTALNRFDTSRSPETGGSGLGLSIIAAIVAEHEGTLNLRRSNLGGLAVEVIL
ncbi:MAG: sensor histidine kinase [Candidatus Planktophila sp.]